MKIDWKKIAGCLASISMGLGLGLGVAASAFAQDSDAPAPRPDDFAGQMSISGSEGDVMFLELPVNVYKHVERTDLGDIRVFDASGLPVPFELRKPERVSITPDPVPVAFFPWQAEEENLPGRTDIQIDATGAVIKVNSPVEDGAKSSTYLLDLGGMQYSPSTLTFDFGNNQEDFNSNVEIRYSNDLASWQPYEKRQTVARFGSEQKTEHFTVQIPKNGPRYLLLILGKNTPQLAGVEASFDPQSRPGELRTTSIQGVKSENGMDVSYNTEGYFPIVAIDFILPKPDSISVDLQNRMTEKAPWAFKAEGDIYRFKPDRSGNERSNKPFEISSRAPYWQLHAAGNVPFVNVPEMAIHWEPYKLVWMARGEGPWILAYGNRDFGLVYDSNLSSVADSQLLEAKIVGDETYAPRPEPEEEPESDYQQWVLWAVLVLAVAVLSGLAYVVAKGMGKKQE